MTTTYWMLAASLPRLPHFERAERLPIGPERLAQRWQMLLAADRARLQSACSLLEMHPPESDEADAAALAVAARRAAAEPDPVVRALVLGRIGERVLFAALRCRRAGRPAPPDLPELPWSLRRRWDEALFGLGGRLPWLADAAALLERRDAIGLERLRCALVWSAAERARRAAPRRFAAMLAYRLQWDVLRRWLGRDATGARALLQMLAADALAAAAPSRR